jgi:nitroreductase
MDVYEALYTTRSMRRLGPEPVPYEAQARILDAAIRAPSPSNTQRWRFLLVDDPELKRQLATIYQANAARLFARYSAMDQTAAADDPAVSTRQRVRGSAEHLAEHWAEVPLFLFGFARDDPSGNSVIPALWSAMLAARAEGVGSTYTTILGHGDSGGEVLRLLGVPADEQWTMTACIAMGYPTGRWGVAERTPVDEVAARNRWDGPLGFSVPEPLWPGRSPG